MGILSVALLTVVITLARICSARASGVELVEESVGFGPRLGVVNILGVRTIIRVLPVGESARLKILDDLNTEIDESVRIARTAEVYERYWWRIILVSLSPFVALLLLGLGLGAVGGDLSGLLGSVGYDFIDVLRFRDVGWGPFNVDISSLPGTLSYCALFVFLGNMIPLPGSPLYRAFMILAFRKGVIRGVDVQWGGWLYLAAWLFFLVAIVWQLF
ncbi:MAG: hypothetical protein QGH94_07210 [Phycisphaerae bacterium]|jgi:hypothetical protein|nr:hypothetical protein [Phycisphaerae bacterium]MDP7287765.1 hypothetical protein [Phycisphaerae bacterium]